MNRILQHPTMIWENAPAEKDSYVRFYDSFSGDGSPVTLLISADSNYEVYLNGRLAAFGQYADFPHYKVYDRITLSKGLCAGENRLVILVWYVGISTQTYAIGVPSLFYRVETEGRTLAESHPGVLCCRARDYQSGRCRLITGQMGPSYTCDLGGALRETCLLTPPTDATPATVAAGAAETLYPRPNRKTELLPFLPAVPIDAARRVYDLGRETVGHLRVSLRAERGTRVTVSWGEHLREGCVARRIGDRDFSVELLASGGEDRFENHMRRLGGRYLQVEADGEAQISEIGVYPVLYPLEERPYRATSPLRQRIYDTAVRTLRLCMFEHYEDCPWREQALYTLDSRNQMRFGYTAFGETVFPRASLSLIGHDDRREDGLLHICAPSQKNLLIPFFSLIYPLQMKEYLDASGDLSLIEEFYPRCVRILDAFCARLEDGLMPNFYGDPAYWNFYEWNPTLEGALSCSQQKSFDTVLNAALVLAAEAMCEMAKALGKEAAADWRALAAGFRQKIREQLFRPEEGLFITSTVHERERRSALVNAMAILAGCATDAEATKICERFFAPDSELIPATLSMLTFVYDACLSVDPARFAPLILSEIDRIYGKMLDEGATSFWETVKGASDFDGAGSLCHGWSALPAYYLPLLEP